MYKNLMRIYLFSFIFLFVDQIIKISLINKFVLYQTKTIIKDLLNITLVHNTGAAFSMLSDGRMFLIVIGIIAFIGISIYLIRDAEISDMGMFIYSLLLGGILGNLLDRIVHGYVIDYISLNIFGYNFPIFNFADSCIVISVVLIIINTIKGDMWKI